MKARNLKQDDVFASSVRGELVSYGRKNIDSSNKDKQDYFVKIKTTKGVELHWGDDMEKTVRTMEKMKDILGFEPGKKISFSPSSRVHIQRNIEMER